ncbi:HlyD family efflux transporter periplasmic adaptor subunit [Clostridium sp. 19966]|uniref:efflux RND transporter periplasmic adaptor subunit n=1 Tax=Clostridium sp. 19966 TaxID=2768166 RepID=UPI0028DDB2BF|nr:HlyD family efflux transporter periplasmic adaptor subunit [Clostridium sp. 19966]MDT8717439.1 HlyD family efflux transporter periplasmic adaptor subunit [Clostridium sp. 19966]
MKRKIIKVLIACVVVGILAGGGFYGYNKLTTSKNTNSTVASYTTVTAKRMSLVNTIEGTGSVYASVIKDVYPNSNGEISNLTANVGDTVKSGDTLFTISSDNLQNNVDQAKVQLDNANLSLTNDSNSDATNTSQSMMSVQNSLTKAQNDYNNMVVKAATSGVVANLKNNNGDSISKNSSVLTIIDPNSIKVGITANTPGAELLSQGEKVQVVIGGKTYTGTVGSGSSTSTNTNNSTALSSGHSYGQSGSKGEGASSGQPQTSGNSASYVSTITLSQASGLSVGLDCNIEINNKTISGKTFASVSTDVYPNNDGTFTNIKVKNGDVVKSGDELFTSDSSSVRDALNSAEDDYNTQKNYVVALDKLSVTSAQSKLDQAEESLSKATVVSSINGVITAKNNNNGDTVQPGTSVLSLMDPTSLKVKVTVDENDINSVKTGQRAMITFSAISNKSYEGTVESVGVQGVTNNNSTSYQVIIKLNDISELKVGMNGDVSIQTASAENAIAVPQSSVISINGEKYVMVPNSDGTSGGDTQASETNQTSQSAQGSSSQGGGFRNRFMMNANGKLTKVTTGIESNGYIEIKEGLSEGDKVLQMQFGSRSSSSSSSSSKSSRSSSSRSGGQMQGGGSFGAPPAN